MFRGEPRSLPIWLVDADDVSRVEPLAPALTARMHLNNLQSAPEILEIGCLLVLWGLPVDLVNAILDTAGAVLECREESDATLYGRAPLNLECLRLDVPAMDCDGLEILRPVAVILETVSRDQGWASDARELNNSYVGCHSWIEYHVQNVLGHDLVRTSCANLRACEHYRRHLTYVTADDVLSLVAPGTSIALRLRAQYGGWSNHIQYARISVVASVALREDVDARSVLAAATLNRPPFTVDAPASSACALM
ncbi:hypothetical protein SPRG_09875 [Saprolegnia parasitica CBS 223.65]|uniref:Uncharacterized protein n=1 Tax=Saprolegnia parasitica (strain CBS 223.65) TaxID=695850 RepID=A0A067C0G0_SAPPC|nr:hypothetical protein SPRG_09875 [Saprolegnia parasitica CBS 223.65]KDO24239.1 hypothetical protein SPRG_09875 [Saprolegnia parasitica CBS 223.65]|eukprot:XP_012205015.1 hypothetical protein SPRG_09875 [Saprolegnia parasitica CBS 223.65]